MKPLVDIMAVVLKKIALLYQRMLLEYSQVHITALPRLELEERMWRRCDRRESQQHVLLVK
jgi:hypothetical protein